MLLSEPFADSQVREEECISAAGTLQECHARSVGWSIMCTPKQVLLTFGWWTCRGGGDNPIRLSHIHRCLSALPLHKERRLSQRRNRQFAPEEKQKRDTPARGTQNIWRITPLGEENLRWRTTEDSSPLCFFKAFEFLAPFLTFYEQIGAFFESAMGGRVCPLCLSADSL